MLKQKIFRPLLSKICEAEIYFNEEKIDKSVLTLEMIMNFVANGDKISKIAGCALLRPNQSYELPTSEKFSTEEILDVVNANPNCGILIEKSTGKSKMKVLKIQN